MSRPFSPWNEFFWLRVKLILFFIAGGGVLFLALSGMTDVQRAEEARRRALEERVERIDERTERIERLLGDGGAK